MTPRTFPYTVPKADEGPEPIDVLEDTAEAINTEMGRHVFDTLQDGLSVHRAIEEQ